LFFVWIINKRSKIAICCGMIMNLQVDNNNTFSWNKIIIHFGIGCFLIYQPLKPYIHLDCGTVNITCFSQVDNINILPLVEGLMVDYHTRKKYHTLEKEYHPRRSWVSGDILFPECDIFTRVWSSTITPSTKGNMFFYFIILHAKIY
jgi:hypothetical protein